MFWTHEAATSPAGGYYIQSKEWDTTESGDYILSDVDEPMCSTGITFDTLAELIEFAESNGLYISNIGQY